MKNQKIYFRAGMTASTLLLIAGVLKIPNASEIHTDSIDITSTQEADIKITGSEKTADSAAAAPSADGSTEASPSNTGSIYDETQSQPTVVDTQTVQKNEQPEYNEIAQSDSESAVIDDSAAHAVNSQTDVPNNESSESTSSYDTTVQQTDIAQQAPDSATTEVQVPQAPESNNTGNTGNAVDTDAPSVPSPAEVQSDTVNNDTTTTTYDYGTVPENNNVQSYTDQAPVAVPGTSHNTTYDHIYESSHSSNQTNYSQNTVYEDDYPSDDSGYVTAREAYEEVEDGAVIVSHYMMPAEKTETGVGNFDDVDYDPSSKKNSGKDSSKTNNIVRNGDKVVYNVKYSLDISGVSEKKKASYRGTDTDVYIKIILPLKEKQASIDTAEIKAQGWKVMSETKDASSQTVLAKSSVKYAGEDQYYFRIPVEVASMENDSVVFLKVQMASEAQIIDMSSVAESRKVTVTSAVKDAVSGTAKKTDVDSSKPADSVDYSYDNLSPEEEASVQEAVAAASKVPRQSGAINKPLTGMMATYGPGCIQP